MKIVTFIKDEKTRLYLIFGAINTLFAYFLSVFLYILLKNYILDYIIFTFVSLINITFSYITMGKYVFKNNLFKLGFNNYLKYVSSSLFNGLVGVTLSTILIRFGIDIYVTQFITISCNILIQIIINLVFLYKKS